MPAFGKDFILQTLNIYGILFTYIWIIHFFGKLQVNTPYIECLG